MRVYWINIAAQCVGNEDPGALKTCPNWRRLGVTTNSQGADGVPTIHKHTEGHYRVSNTAQ
jgi:hypothetical protein